MINYQRIIWLASYPKSGNTWMRILLANYFMPRGKAPDINHLYEFTTSDVRQDFFDRVAGRPFQADSFDEWLMIRPKVLRAIAISRPGHHFVKTHCKVMRIGDYDLIMPEVTAAAIYIMRNPFDVALSYSRHLSLSIDDTITRMLDTKTTFTTPSNLFDVLGRWDDHITSWTQAPGLTRHVMRYEDILADPEKTLRQLLGFLKAPVNDGQLRYAIRAASFDNLQKQERKQGFRERPEKMERFFVSGRAGGWREALSQAQISRICDGFRDALGVHYPDLLAEADTMVAKA